MRMRALKVAPVAVMRPRRATNPKLKERQALRWLHGQLRDQVYAWCTIGTGVSAREVADRVLFVLLESGAANVQAIERLIELLESPELSRVKAANRKKWGLSPTGNRFWSVS